MTEINFIDNFSLLLNVLNWIGPNRLSKLLMFSILFSAEGIIIKLPPFSTNDFKVVCNAWGISGNSFNTIASCFQSNYNLKHSVESLNN